MNCQEPELFDSPSASIEAIARFILGLEWPKEIRTAREEEFRDAEIAPLFRLHRWQE